MIDTYKTGNSSQTTEHGAEGEIGEVGLQGAAEVLTPSPGRELRAGVASGIRSRARRLLHFLWPDQRSSRTGRSAAAVSPTPVS